MGNTDEKDDAIAARREFVRRLRAHEDVHRVTFSRDGFRTVIVSLESNTGFRDRWHRTADRLGYTVERVASDESRVEWPEDVWILQLGDDEEPIEPSTWRATIQSAVGRVRRLVDHLRGGTNR